ncbi:DnaJ domain-containing protein [Methanobrevibacter sp.]|uniref:J domain-containing protein n=1 Tax=Methanobrevibacter sp. TaxID=66852 RepID=UPI003866F5C4
MNVYQAYQILELRHYATEKEIKERYRALVLKWHPDVNSWDTTARFQEIQEAYETVINHVKSKNTKKRTSTNVKQPVKRNTSKTSTAYTHKTKSSTKKPDTSSISVGWIFAGVFALIILLIIVPGLQLLVLFMILYVITRIL